MDLLAMFIMISLLHIAPLISKILANVVVLIANYLFSKFFIFKNLIKIQRSYNDVPYHCKTFLNFPLLTLERKRLISH